MAPGAVTTVAQYLASLPADRRAALARVRDVINSRIPRGYEETLQYGMISWIVPRTRLAATYNGQPLAIASLASHKQAMALYLLGVYGDPQLAAWFQAAYRATGKKLDMGKSCVRFKTLDQLPLEVVGEVIAKLPVEAAVAAYEASRSKTVKPRPVAGAATRASATRAPAGKAAAPARKARAAAVAGKAPRATRAARPRAAGGTATSRPARAGARRGAARPARAHR